MNHIAELTEQVKALREKIGRQGQFMDPNASLRDLLDFFADLRKDPSDAFARAAAVDRLQALADWIRRGGFPPSR